MSSDLSVRGLFVSSEARPFASSGGLGDVAQALPDALNAQGIRFERVMPLYRRVVEGQGTHGYTLERTPHTLAIPMGQDVFDADIWAANFNGVRTYFIGRDEYFDRSELYALPHRAYSDNFERFVFFQKAVVALIDGLGKPYDLIHLNDWQTGLIPLYLKNGINGTGRSASEKTVFTIHNIAYQGTASESSMYETNLPGTLRWYPELEFYGELNSLKAGIMLSDQCTTVSHRYADEIQTAEFGCGLEGVLQHLEPPVRGIVNGVDYATWNPETNPTLAANYSPRALAGKESCKKAVLQHYGLKYAKDIPVFSMISRMVDQKGFDLIAGAIEQIMELPIQFILLGSGQDIYQDMARKWAERWPDKCAIEIGFNSALSHQIEAGADFFFMPSKFEPCGLNQLYSLKYATIPIVSNVGGLADTVRDIRSTKDGTGFIMDAYTVENFIECVRAALSLFGDKKQLRETRKMGMKQDYSWNRAGEEYLALYEDLLQSVN